MNVELLQYPEDPERAVATAARLCYAPVGAKELMETMPPERVESVLSTFHALRRHGFHELFCSNRRIA